MSSPKVLGLCSFVFFLLLSSQITVAAVVPFIVEKQYPAGGDPISLVTGDFNKDGKIDVASLNFFGSVSILLGKGDGTFKAPLGFAAGQQGISISKGDFNGDGNLDLITSDASFTINVLIGNGDGTFKAPLQHHVDAYPLRMAIGDFDGDGRLDLAGRTTQAVAITVLWGNGDGTFSGEDSFDTPGYPIWAAAADLNGDGRPDLVTADSSEERGKVAVFLSKGHRQFQHYKRFKLRNDPQFFASGDLDGDGKRDLIVSVSQKLHVYLGNGDGTFREQKPISATPRALALSDMNHDGKLDVVTLARGVSPSVVKVRYGRGDGTFEPEVAYAAQGRADCFALGDFNGDGQDDVALGIYDSSIAVLTSKPDGNLRSPSSYSVGNVFGVATGDFNGDGKPDVVAVDSFSRDVHILVGKGDGTFSFAKNLQNPVPGILPYVGDFNNDGKLDLAVANNNVNNVSIYLGRGDGTFGPPTNFSEGGQGGQMTIADFNKDGNQDLAVATSTAGFVTVALGKGDGTFGDGVGLFTGVNPTDVKAADLNGDNNLDLVVSNGGNNNEGNIAVLLGKGDGTFKAPKTYPVGLPGVVSVAVVDTNHDGNLDVIVGAVFGGGIDTLLGNGDGTLQPQKASGQTEGSGGVAVADFDGDGNVDVYLASDHGTLLMTGNGDGTFTPGFTYDIEGYWFGPAAVADFNADGKTDLAAAAQAVVVLLHK
jgi:hypothetical protein